MKYLNDLARLGYFIVPMKKYTKSEDKQKLSCRKGIFRHWSSVLNLRKPLCSHQNLACTLLPHNCFSDTISTRFLGDSEELFRQLSLKQKFLRKYSILMPFS